MCLTAVDIQYDGLLRPWLGYIMARKVPWLLAVTEAAFSATQVGRFFFPCTAAFILLLQSGRLEPKNYFSPHLFPECITFLFSLLEVCDFFCLLLSLLAREWSGFSYSHIEQLDSGNSDGICVG